jgi:hypothetical protein
MVLLPCVSAAIQANEKVDQSLTALLRLLSPFFLLKPTHKVFEFLIRRFHIHEHNTDIVMECILPYHETNYFARMLQLTKCAPFLITHFAFLSIISFLGANIPISLQFDSSLRLPVNSRWEFLAASQKASAPLARATLVSRCLVDLEVLEFIANVAEHAAESSRGSGSDCHKSAMTLFSVVALEVIARFCNFAPSFRHVFFFSTTAQRSLNRLRLISFHHCAII